MEYKTHIGVYGVLLEANRILLVTKSRGPYAGKLDLPGGRFEHGETILEALSREVYEETGIEKISGLSFLNNFTHHVVYDNGNLSLHHIGLVYLVKDFLFEAKEINFEDVSGVNWFDRDQLREEHVSPFAWRVLNLETAVAHGKSPQSLHP